MAGLLDKTFSGAELMILLGVVFGGFLVLFLLFAILSGRANKRICENMKKGLVLTQEQMFSNAASLLADKLVEYTDGLLLDRVNQNYVRLVSEDLLPSVNSAAEKITELAEQVTRRQEQGMEVLAEHFAGMLASKTEQYIQMEFQVVDSLRQSAGNFSAELSHAVSAVRELGSLQDTALEQVKAVSDAAGQAAVTLSGQIGLLGAAMEGTRQSVDEIHSLVEQNGRLAASMTSAAAQVQQTAEDSARLLAEQNQITAQNLRDASGSIQENTSLAAKAVLEEFTAGIAGTTSSITDSVAALKQISEEIHSSATRFSESLAGSYQGLGDNLDQTLERVGAALNDTVSSQYQKMVLGAEHYSESFLRSMATLQSDLDAHIANLQSATGQLNHNMALFKEETGASTHRFETGMEEAVSAALGQLDASLAEIVSRLAAVTASIQEAAAALPGALQAIRKER